MRPCAAEQRGSFLLHTQFRAAELTHGCEGGLVLVPCWMWKAQAWHWDSEDWLVARHLFLNGIYSSAPYSDF